MEPQLRNTGGAAPPAPTAPADPTTWASTHPKINSAVFAGSLAALVLGTIKATWGVDLHGQEGNLMVVLMGAVGYLTPS